MYLPHLFILSFGRGVYSVRRVNKSGEEEIFLNFLYTKEESLSAAWTAADGTAKKFKSTMCEAEEKKGSKGSRPPKRSPPSWLLESKHEDSLVPKWEVAPLVKKELRWGFFSLKMSSEENSLVTKLSSKEKDSLVQKFSSRGGFFSPKMASSEEDSLVS
jgi:hypothetical protein